MVVNKSINMVTMPFFLVFTHLWTHLSNWTQHCECNTAPGELLSIITSAVRMELDVWSKTLKLLFYKSCTIVKVFWDHDIIVCKEQRKNVFVILIISPIFTVWKGVGILLSLEFISAAKCSELYVEAYIWSFSKIAGRGMKWTFSPSYAFEITAKHCHCREGSWTVHVILI